MSKMYRKQGKQGESSWATREIAALDFLLNIPLQGERDIVLTGLEAERDLDTSGPMDLDQSHGSRNDESVNQDSYDRNQGFKRKGGWWDSIVKSDSRIYSVEDRRLKQKKQLELETGLLERPDDVEITASSFINNGSSAQIEPAAIATFIPGRRLDGHEATRVHIPREALETELKTRHRTVARKAAEIEWEKNMRGTGLQEGRIFFSSANSYPIQVFSVIKYDPKNEEEIRRRQKLEALGGGGTQFVLPSRDWRGVSYRALLPRRDKKNKAFNRQLEKRIESLTSRYMERMNLKENVDGYHGDYDHSSSDDEQSFPKLSMSGEESEDEVISVVKERVRDADEDVESINDDDTVSSSSSDESSTYEPGFLDDPDIKKGKHRTAMVGDKVTGCIVSSIIHYVRPADLKADLNRQFRQRFDQWEPPKSRRKYIGARVVDGTYKLMDPAENTIEIEKNDALSDDDGNKWDGRRRKNSVALEYENIRMPPSLTLSKIRSVKQAALLACVRAKIEVSTVALACVYFERLALDCRVDKSNRRLTFAACLLIAIKFNSESNVKLVHEKYDKESKKSVLKSLIKPRKDSSFWEPLFLFFTHDWELSLKKVFDIEWAVFAYLDFKLHASPSDVSFHFKRLMKFLGWSPLDYLDKHMYTYWQESLEEEAVRNYEKETRRMRRQRQKERKILKLQRELQEKESEFVNHKRQRSPLPESVVSKSDGRKQSDTASREDRDVSPKNKRKPGIGIFSRLKRSSHSDFQASIVQEKGKCDLIRMNEGLHRSVSSPNLSSREPKVDLEGETRISKTIHVDDEK